jgi:hypothetical protein
MRGKYTNHYTTDVGFCFFLTFNKDLNIQILVFKQYIFGNKIFCIFSIIYDKIINDISFKVVFFSASKIPRKKDK